MKKKIVSITMLLLLALVLVACGGNGNNLEQEEADFNEMLLLVDISVPTGDRGSVVNSFSVPVTIAGGGTVAWTSTNEDHAKFGVVSGQNLIVITRPSSEENDVTLTVTGTLTWTGPSGTEYSDKVDFQIRVLAMPASTVATIADVRTGEYAEGDNVKFEDVVIIHVASNGISIFDPETKHAIFVYGSAIADISNVGDKGDIVGEYAVNFDSPQLTKATFTKESEVELEDLLAMAKEIDVADYWLEPGSSVEEVLAAKQDPEMNAFVKFTANVKDHPEWASNSTTNYTTVLHDPEDEDKYVRSYYGGMKHSDLVTLSGTDNVTIYAVAYTIRDDRVKPSTIEGVLPSYEIFVIHYDATLTDEQKVTLDKNNIQVDTVILETTTITLPTTGAHGSTITWETTDAELFNVETGVVTVTQGVSKSVKLTATINQGGVTQTREFNITLGILTIAEVNTKEKGDLVYFIGTITGFTPFTSYGNFDAVFMEDETGSIYIHRSSLPETIAIGDKYEVYGELDIYNGLIQIAQAGQVYEFISSGNAVSAPTVVTDLSTLVVADQASQISFSGVVKSVNASGQNLVVTVGEDDITIRSMSNSAEAPINAHFLTAVVGQTVNVTGVHVGWFNGPQLIPSLVSQFEFVELTDAEKLAQAEAALVAEFDGEEFNMESDIVLPLEGLHGVEVSWAMDPAEAIADGKWFTVAADTPVTLTATLTLGEEEPVIIELEVTVKFVDSSAPTAPVVVTATSNNSSSNMEEGTNYASQFGLDPDIFTVTTIQGTGTTGLGLYSDIRLYGDRNSGNGNSLIITIASGFKITDITYKFVGSTNSATASLTFDDQAAIDLTTADVVNTDKVYTDLNATKIVLHNTHTGGSKNGQVRIESIIITFIEEN